MKKLIILLFCFVSLFLLTGAAAPSPSTETLIWCEPEISFKVLDEIDLELYLSGYELIEALEITLDKQYEQITWYLPIEIMPNCEIKSAIIGNDLLLDDAIITKENGIIVNFSNVQPGTYYLYFFMRRDINENENYSGFNNYFNFNFNS